MVTEIKEGLILGFQHTPGVHCTSSALRNIFDFNGFKLSEAMVFGLGSGMGLGYLKTRGMNVPMIGGRQHKFEDNLCKLLNVKLIKYTTKKADEGWNRLKTHLMSNKPCAINVDMAYLDYADIPEDWHFGQHTIVICGYNPSTQKVYVTDTDNPEILDLPVDSLNKARNSQYSRWMAPYNMIFEMDFPNELPAFADVIPTSVRTTGKQLLTRGRFMKFLGIHNGVSGLTQFIKDVLTWNTLTKDSLQDFGIQTAGFISDYGTGGGLFRYLYADFLQEASDLSNSDQLAELGRYYRNLGDQWEDVSSRFQSIHEKSSGAELEEELKLIQNKLMDIVALETQGAQKLTNFEL
ncbi:MAG: BtrH N-terminal domain-containing protein [Candidatus Hodarchaeales archaeon]|jgi:hypothetical protein